MADEPQPIRVLLVEDNDVFRQALDAPARARRTGSRSRARSRRGTPPSSAYREHRPDVVVMDFRLPGMDGVETTLALVSEYPEVAVVCLTASASPRELDALLRRGRDRLPPQGRGARRDRRRDQARGRGEGRPVNLTGENTAVVLDSTADFPDAQIRFPNMRVVPLYVRFGEESFRDYVELDPHDFYDAAATAPELPTTSQPTPQDFLAAYHALAGYERIYSLHISRSSRARSRARPSPPRTSGERIRLVDTESASVGIGMLSLAIQELLARGTTDEEIEALIAQLPRALGDPLHRRHARVPRRRAAGSGAARR